ncbi:ABC transporter permease [Streptomyces sp. NPDC001634]|uniref:ABC transporter permease n=1 Tax=Streptomyces sp. NPDC001634 TaxID=3154390 RepID=UPI0033214213
MSTVMDKAPAVPAPVRTGRHPASAVLALARFEARELLLQLPVFVVFLLYIGYTSWKLFSPRDGMDDYPILQNTDRATQPGSLFLAIVVLICVNVAALRSRRNGTDRHFDVLVMEPWRRTVAHALSVVPFAAVTALVVAAQFGWAALKPGAVGHGSVAELAVAPLSVLLAGVLGVLIARLFPSAAGLPVFMGVGFAALMAAFAVAGPNAAHWPDWLFPLVSEDGTKPLPSGLLGRPAAWHALYLAGLTALLLCVAVLLSGGRTRLMKAVTAVALGATVAGIAGQSPSHESALIAAREKASRTPVTSQECVTHGRSRYCSFPEWTAWRDQWAAVVDRIQDLAGGGAGGARLTVRQRIPAIHELDEDSSLDPLRAPGEVTVGTRWGGNRIPEFSVGAAAVLVAGDELAGTRMCDARVVTVMWLALAAQDDPMTALRNVRLDDSIKGSAIAMTPTDGVFMSAEQTRIVRELLQRPRFGVTAKVKAHWTELMSPKTSEARVAEMLGVPAAKDTEKGTEKGASCSE